MILVMHRSTVQRLEDCVDKDRIEGALHKAEWERVVNWEERAVLEVGPEQYVVIIRYVPNEKFTETQWSFIWLANHPPQRAETPVRHETQES